MEGPDGCAGGEGDAPAYPSSSSRDASGQDDGDQDSVQGLRPKRSLSQIEAGHGEETTVTMSGSVKDPGVRPNTRSTRSSARCAAEQQQQQQQQSDAESAKRRKLDPDLPADGGVQQRKLTGEGSGGSSTPVSNQSRTSSDPPQLASGAEHGAGAAAVAREPPLEAPSASAAPPAAAVAPAPPTFPMLAREVTSDSDSVEVSMTAQSTTVAAAGHQPLSHSVAKAPSQPPCTADISSATAATSTEAPPLHAPLHETATAQGPSKMGPTQQATASLAATPEGSSPASQVPASAMEPSSTGPRLGTNTISTHTQTTSTCTSTSNALLKSQSQIAESSPPSANAADAQRDRQQGQHETTAASTSAEAPAAHVPGTASAQTIAPQSPPSPTPPLKSLKMSHLRKKYYQELEYMQREFKKLERQLLGAKNIAGATESAGSRERREKLHSFILHLTDTMNQIEVGCRLEKEGKSTVGAASVAQAGEDAAVGPVSSAAAPSDAPTSEDAKKQFAHSAALTKLTREKEEEENVQKLEEHILANLLPVKDRLTKQLAAQQGAARNPAGMPSSRGRGLAAPSATVAGGKGTFAAAAEQRRIREEALRLKQQQAEEDAAGPPPTSSLLGKPLGGGGSSLTQKLHGATLGSKKRPAGDGVGQAAASATRQPSQHQQQLDDQPETKRKVLYAGMAPGSEQVSSSVRAAQGAHDMVVEDPALRAVQTAEGAEPPPPQPPPPPPPPPPAATAVPSAAVPPGLVHTSGSDSSTASGGATGVAVTLQRQAEAAARAAAAQAASAAGPASAAVAKAQAASAASAAALAARAKARAAAGLPPVSAVITSAAVTKGGQAQQAVGRRTKRYLSDPTLTEEERQRLVRRRDRRKRRRKKARRLERERQRHAAYAAQQRHAQAQSAAAAAAAAAAQAAKADPPTKGRGKGKGGKKGPRTVEYICGLCNEPYPSTCDANPWWALVHQDCGKCGKKQIPRIDISAPANAIEYHPALLAHAEDSAQGSQGGAGGASTAAGSGMVHGALRGGIKAPAGAGAYVPSHLAQHPMNKFGLGMPEDDPASDLSDADEGVSLDGDSSEDSGDEDLLGFTGGPLTPAERAEAEDFGKDYSGPKLTDAESARALILIGHASTCPGRHKTAKTRSVCHGTKYMMLHVRDCPGTTSTFDVCPFPWCRKIKHLLYHLVSCRHPEECRICSPKDLSPALKALTGLNAYRRKKQKERAAAALAAAASAAGVRGSRAPKGTASASNATTYAHVKREADAAAPTKLPQINLPPTKFIPTPSPAPTIKAATATHYVAKPSGAPGVPLTAGSAKPVTSVADPANAASIPAVAVSSTAPAIVATAKTAIPTIIVKAPVASPSGLTSQEKIAVPPVVAAATAATPVVQATAGATSAGKSASAAAAAMPKSTEAGPAANIPVSSAQSASAATAGTAAPSMTANAIHGVAEAAVPQQGGLTLNPIPPEHDARVEDTTAPIAEASAAGVVLKPTAAKAETSKEIECAAHEGPAENPSALVSGKVTEVAERETSEDCNCADGANACAKGPSAVSSSVLTGKRDKTRGNEEEGNGGLLGAGDELKEGESKDSESLSKSSPPPGTPPENAAGCSGEVTNASEPSRVIDE